MRIVVLIKCFMSLYGLVNKYIFGVDTSASVGKKEHGAFLNRLETRISRLEKELPSVSMVKNSPKAALESLLAMDVPDVFIDEYQDKVNECGHSLKVVNDKNDASVLMWTYMVNNLYQKTLSEIAEVSNTEMTNLNALFVNWKNRITELENQVETERGRLGL